jgi:hypothetical protein
MTDVYYRLADEVDRYEWLDALIFDGADEDLARLQAYIETELAARRLVPMLPTPCFGGLLPDVIVQRRDGRVVEAWIEIE